MQKEKEGRGKMLRIKNTLNTVCLKNNSQAYSSNEIK
jgi:hypothetical protein